MSTVPNPAAHLIDTVAMLLAEREVTGLDGQLLDRLDRAYTTYRLGRTGEVADRGEATDRATLAEAALDRLDQLLSAEGLTDSERLDDIGETVRLYRRARERRGGAS